MSTSPKHLNVHEQGLQIAIKDRNILKSYIAGIELVKYFYDHRLCGTDKIRKFIVSGKQISEIKEWCEKDIDIFLKQREKYLLY